MSKEVKKEMLEHMMNLWVMLYVNESPFASSCLQDFEHFLDFCYTEEEVEWVREFDKDQGYFITSEKYNNKIKELRHKKGL